MKMEMRVPENNVFRRMFGLQKEQVREEWRKLHEGELHTYLGRSNHRGRVAYSMHPINKNVYEFLVKNIKGRDYLRIFLFL
jgi:hypothetical protein